LTSLHITSKALVLLNESQVGDVDGFKE
jgi:hypothetical protein